MDNIPQLIPYLYIISGCINAIIAWIDLEQKLIRYYVFYKPLVLNKPLKNLPFGLWLAIQIIFPALFIWVTISNCTKPSTTIEYAQLGANILVYGVFFQVFSGTTEKLGMSPINLIIPLTWANILYEVYLNSTEGKLARQFWINLETELKKLKQRDLLEGLDYIENYYFVQPL